MTNTERNNRKEKIRIRQLIIQELLEISELWGDVPIARHLYVALRPKTESFNWSDETLLKRIEKYRAELEEIQLDDDGCDRDDE